MKALSLSEAEIAAITEPMQQPGAQARALRAMGFTVKLKPNGRPLVSGANFEAVMGGGPVRSDSNDEQAAVPDEGALMLMFNHKGEKMGRKRKQNPLGLPERVYARHGAFFYVHRDGRWERLGTDVTEAKRKGTLHNDPQGTYGTIGYFLDTFIIHCEKRAQAGDLAPRTLA